MSAASRREGGILGLEIGESVSPCMNSGVSGVPPAGECRFRKQEYTDPESWQHVSSTLFLVLSSFSISFPISFHPFMM